MLLDLNATVKPDIYYLEVFTTFWYYYINGYEPLTNTVLVQYTINDMYRV